MWKLHIIYKEERKEGRGKEDWKGKERKEGQKERKEGCDLNLRPGISYFSGWDLRINVIKYQSPPPLFLGPGLYLQCCVGHISTNWLQFIDLISYEIKCTYTVKHSVDSHLCTGLHFRPLFWLPLVQCCQTLSLPSSTEKVLSLCLCIFCFSSRLYFCKVPLKWNMFLEL